MRLLVIAHDIKLLTSWDHTATLAAGTYNLTCVVINAVSKSKMRPRQTAHFHPYRKRPNVGLQITKDNFEDLRLIGGLMVKR